MVVKGDPRMAAELEAWEQPVQIWATASEDEAKKNTYCVNVLRGDLHIWKVGLKPL